MPIYTCECCKYTTTIKTQFERHNSTIKHLNNINNKSVLDIQETKDIEILIKEIAVLKQENLDMKIAIQECKHLINDMKANFAISPQQIIISQQPQKAEEIKLTCNPRYIEKKLNKEFADHENIDDYFSFKSDNINIDFDDIENPCEITRTDAINKIVKIVKNKIKSLPFKYIKNSWYIKQKDGWEREVPVSNKGIQTTSESYNHSIIVKKLLYIFKTNAIKYFDVITGNSDWRGVTSNFAELANETFDIINYRNKDILNLIKEFYDYDEQFNEKNEVVK